MHLILMHWLVIEDNIIWRVLATFAMMTSLSWTWKASWVPPKNEPNAATTPKKAEKSN